MKRIFLIVTMLLLMFTVVGCTHQTAPSDTAPASNTTADKTSDKKVLIAYFSRADENYGVGYVEKGNTAHLAEIIAEETGGTLFEIKSTTPYPKSYKECGEFAKKERDANARPALTATVDNFDEYDVIYLGYPIWWHDLPMPVYTFLESYNFTGKTIIPFCTHAGSGLDGTDNQIRSTAPNATVGKPLVMYGTTAQNEPRTARHQVVEWLNR